MTPDDMAQMDRIFAERMSNGSSPAELANWQKDFIAAQAGPAAAPAAANFSSAPYANGMYGGQRMGMGMGMMNRYGGMGYYGGGEGPGGAGLGGMMSRQPVVAEGKGKGKLVELSDANWEAEFARIGSDGTAQVEAKEGEAATTTTTTAEPRDDMTLEEIREMAKEEGIDVDSSEADAEFLKSLEATWKNLQGTMQQSSLADQELAQWEAQYGTNFADPDADDGPMMNLPEITPETVSEFLKNPTPYPFQAENPFLADDFSDPYAEGQRLLASGAPLSTAALAFEAACQKNDNRAWRPLGETQAADEKETLAIRAFEKAVELGEPLDAQKAWLALAISYVNEGQELRALATLEKWLQDTYPAAIMSVQRPPDTTNPWDRHSRVVDMFLAAARAGPTGRTGTGSYDVQKQPVDADVQVGLGVLFYANSEYERAKDCFEAALGVNPDDFLLWNRLGATLANGGSPETAIDAYRKALELRPTFTRAIYNLGVSCLNVGCFQEAAEHLLAALSLHGRTKGKQKNPLLPEGDGSDNLWHTLRRAFLCMVRFLWHCHLPDIFELIIAAFAGTD